MNLASWIMDRVFPERLNEREQIRQALNRNSQETEKLTIVVQKAAFRPDQTMRLHINGNHRTR